MEIINHKLGEKFTLLTELPPEATTYRVARVTDGRFYNKLKRQFETYISSDINNFLFNLHTHHIPGLASSEVEYLPEAQQDLIFEFLQKDIDGNYHVVSRERHVFGGFKDKDSPKLCIIFGYIYDPSGRPVVGARVDATLNRNGYFIDKTPLLAPTSYAITDDSGYFEMPLMQGINVTITIAALGFVTKGYVPLLSNVKLSAYCLSSEGR